MAAAARDRSRPWQPFGVTEADFAAAPEHDGVRVVNVRPGGPGPGGQAPWWLGCAAIAVAVLAAAAAVVSWDAQYTMVRSARHVAVVEVESVQTQLLGILTQVPGLSSVRDYRPGLTLQVDESFAVAEPVRVHVESSQVRLVLEATITDRGTGRAGKPHALSDHGHGVYEVEFAGCGPGDYTVTVQGTGGSASLVQPVSDVFVVLPDDPDHPHQALISPQA